MPVLEAVHDRVVIEVMRGCTAGCRFCQAGMWYRPVRERPVDLVVAAADRLLDETGCDEVSLLSLSSCDYGGVAEALTRIRELRPGLRVSLPSLRIDSAAESLAGFAADQRGSLTLAPEAGTQELRDAINKGVDEAQFDEAVRATFEGGFTGLKLYFMIGLPGETDDDVLGIARMAATAARLAKEIGRGRARLSRVGVVLRAQGAHAVRAGAVRRRGRRCAAGSSSCATPCRAACACRSTTWPPSVVEATLARGGPGTDRLVEEAWRRGARFDGWSEHFDVRRWEDGGRGDRRSRSASRPWRRAGLARRRGRAPRRGLPRRRARAQPRAASSPRTAATAPAPPAASAAARSAWSCSHDLVARQLRAHAARRAICRTWTRRAWCSARSRAPACPSRCRRACAPSRASRCRCRCRSARPALDELAVVEVPEGVEATDGGAARRCAPPSPPGFEFAEHRRRRRAAIRARRRCAAEYACVLDGDAGAIVAAVERYNDAEHAIRERVSPKGTRRLDLKDYAGDVVATPVEGGARLGFTIRHRSDGAARPQELIDLIAEWAEVEPAMRGLERLRIAWDHGLPAPRRGQRKELTT